MTISRILEDVAFALGIVLLGSYALSETLLNLGWRLGPHEPGHDFPWGQVLISAIFIAPKLLGRATAGKIWDAIGRRFGAKDAEP